MPAMAGTYCLSVDGMDRFMFVQVLAIVVVRGGSKSHQVTSCIDLEQEANMEDEDFGYREYKFLQ